jgi:hypothetical protein
MHDDFDGILESNRISDIIVHYLTLLCGVDSCAPFLTLFLHRKSGRARPPNF